MNHFRAWDSRAKTMNYPPNAKIWMDTNGVCFHMQSGVKMEPMLFVGINDSNEKKIYWGDFIKYYGYEARNIKGKCTQIRPERFLFLERLSDLIKLYNISESRRYANEGTFEVIGNFHENPELKELLK